MADQRQGRAGSSRLAVIDQVRGVAILLMIVYHFSWDLTFFGLAQFRIFTDPWWIWFANIIVIMILGVMGVSQVLARDHGFNFRKFLKRFLKIASAAALVSLATWWMDPTTFVFFGILHHVAVASVLIAGAIYLPTVVLALLAVFVFSAQFWMVDRMFSPEWLLWLGLSPFPRAAVDFVPLVPWFAVPLAGIVLGRWLVGGGYFERSAKWQPTAAPFRIIRLAGRHSLAIYLIHQPILYGALYLFMWARG